MTKKLGFFSCQWLIQWFVLFCLLASYSILNRPLQPCQQSDFYTWRWQNSSLTISPRWGPSRDFQQQCERMSGEVSPAETFFQCDWMWTIGWTSRFRVCGTESGKISKRFRIRFPYRFRPNICWPGTETLFVIFAAEPWNSNSFDLRATQGCKIFKVAFAPGHFFHHSLKR